MTKYLFTLILSLGPKQWKLDLLNNTVPLDILQ